MPLEAFRIHSDDFEKFQDPTYISYSLAGFLIDVVLIGKGTSYLASNYCNPYIEQKISAYQSFKENHQKLVFGLGVAAKIIAAKCSNESYRAFARATNRETFSYSHFVSNIHRCWKTQTDDSFARLKKEGRTFTAEYCLAYDLNTQNELLYGACMKCASLLFSYIGQKTCDQLIMETFFKQKNSNKNLTWAAETTFAGLFDSIFSALAPALPTPWPQPQSPQLKEVIQMDPTTRNAVVLMKLDTEGNIIKKEQIATDNEIQS